jgi:flagellar protein FliJ
MKSFSFRLERILRLREQAEQGRARTFGAAAREEAQLDRLVRDQADYLASIGDRLAPKSGDQMSAGWLRVLTLTAAAAQQQLEDTEKSREDARKAADEARARLAEARVERRSLERLREKQQAAWGLEARREEQKTLDEIAGRRRSGDGEA